MPRIGALVSDFDQYCQKKVIIGRISSVNAPLLMPRPAPKGRALACELSEPAPAGGKPMAVQEYGVRQSDGTWQVWHSDALMSCHTTYLAALRAAEVLSRQATSHGQRSKIV